MNDKKKPTRKDQLCLNCSTILTKETNLTPIESYKKALKKAETFGMYTQALSVGIIIILGFVVMSS